MAVKQDYLHQIFLLLLLQAYTKNKFNLTSFTSLID